MRRIRLIGGPFHGEIRAIRPTDTRIVALEHTARPLFAYVNLSPYPERDIPFTEIVYERRQLALGPWAKVELFAPRSMEEPEFMRRVADLIEGVGEQTTQR